MPIIKASLWDRMQYIFRNYYDRMMHACLYYESTLNENALREAFTILVTKIPVLRSRYVANPIKPYWRITPHVNSDNFFSFIEVDDLDAAAESFLNTSFPAQSDYQLRVLLARSNGKDVLCVLVNHMCFDGADFKYFNKKVAECYSNIVMKNLHTVDIKAGSRSDGQLYDSFNDEDKKSAYRLTANASAAASYAQFPYDTYGSTDRQMIVKRKIARATFLKIKEKGKVSGATLNDIILAAYFRAFYKIAGRDPEEALTIANMIDLRRHISTGDTAGLTNMTGMFMCAIDRLGADIFETVGIVREALKATKKDRFIGLHGVPLLKLAFSIFPHFLAETCIKIGYKNPLLGMSNIGIIEDKMLIMGGVKLIDAFMTGATKYKPYIQLALTTFREEITFTVAVKANNNDRKRIERLLISVEDELNNYIK